MPKEKWIGAQQVRENDLTMGVEVLDTDKTLFVAPMNDEAGENPTPVQCKTMSEVFSTFRPKMEISVETEDGSTSDAEVKFERIADFLPESVIAQAPALKALHAELVILKDLLSQMRNNRNLRRAVDSPEERKVLVEGVQMTRKALGAKES